MSQKITEKEVAQSLLDSAYVLITQPEADITGQEVESLRRIPLSVLLKKCGGNGDGEVDPEIVKQIVDEYLAENPPSGVTDQEIADAVGKYLTENPVEGVTDQQVYDAVVAYLTENPVESVTDEQIARAVENYMAEHPIEGGGSSEPGENGGYYTPTVTQTDANTMTVSFAASKEGMAAVEDQTITLPAGKDGNGIKSLVLNDDYTLTLTFDDGTTYTTPSIRGATGGDGKDGKDGTSVTVSSVSESTEDGGNNVVTFSDGKTLTVKNGKTGGKGDKGDPYVLTDADKEEIAETVKAEVPLVKVAEQPTFANSVDEMTDTSKVYVMPDMSMWAWMKGEVKALTESDFVATAMEANGSYNLESSVNNHNRIATKDLLPLSSKISVSCPSGYQYFVYYYTDNTVDSYIGKTTWKKRRYR